MWWLVVVVAGSCCLAAVDSYYSRDVDVGGSELYDNSLMQDLYKRLAAIDPAYFLDRPMPGGQVYDSRAGWLDEDEDDGDGGLKSRPRSAVAGGQTDTRDSEYIGHSSNAATNQFIYMSGRLLTACTTSVVTLPSRTACMAQQRAVLAPSP